MHSRQPQPHLRHQLLGQSYPDKQQQQQPPEHGHYQHQHPVQFPVQLGLNSNVEEHKQHNDSIPIPPGATPSARLTPTHNNENVKYTRNTNANPLQILVFSLVESILATTSTTPLNINLALEGDPLRSQKTPSTTRPTLFEIDNNAKRVLRRAALIRVSKHLNEEATRIGTGPATADSRGRGVEMAALEDQIKWIKDLLMRQSNVETSIHFQRLLRSNELGILRSNKAEVLNNILQIFIRTSQLDTSPHKDNKHHPTVDRPEGPQAQSAEQITNPRVAADGRPAASKSESFVKSATPNEADLQVNSIRRASRREKQNSSQDLNPFKQLDNQTSQNSQRKKSTDAPQAKGEKGTTVPQGEKGTTVAQGEKGTTVFPLSNVSQQQQESLNHHIGMTDHLHDSNTHTHSSNNYQTTQQVALHQTQQNRDRNEVNSEQHRVGMGGGHLEGYQASAVVATQSESATHSEDATVSDFTSNRNGSNPLSRRNHHMGGGAISAPEFGHNESHKNAKVCDSGEPLDFPAHVHKETITISSSAVAIDHYVFKSAGEKGLVRDALYCFQGIDGLYIKFDESKNLYSLRQDVRCSEAVRTTINKICQIGVLYKTICRYTSTKTFEPVSQGGGPYKGGDDYNSSLSPPPSVKPVLSLIKDAFIQCIEGHLTEHYRFLAHLEKLLNDGSLTLRKLAIKVPACYGILRHLATLVDACGNLKGGELLTVIQAHSNRGEVKTRHSMAEVLERTLAPLYSMVLHWITRGEILDPYDEFFVKSNNGGEPTDANTADEENGGTAAGVLSGGSVAGLSHFGGLANAKRQRSDIFGTSCNHTPHMTSTVASSPRGISKFWSDGFILDFKRVPNFITLELANKIFLAGKSRFFIRLFEQLARTYQIGPFKDTPLRPVSSGYSDLRSDSGSDIDDATMSGVHLDEVAVQRKSPSGEHKFALDKNHFEAAVNFNSLTSLQIDFMIDPLALKQNRRLVVTLLERFNLLEECAAIKSFLLMFQGDFVDRFLNLAERELDKPGSHCLSSPHILRSLLHSAIRCSNAQFLSVEILNRVDVKLLQNLSFAEKGWDVLCLDYKIGDHPVAIVLNPKVMSSYRQIFCLLWKLKRVDFSISRVWNVYMRKSDLDANIHIRPTIFLCRRLRGEMSHFVQNLQSYLMHDILATNWRTLEARFSKVDSIDNLQKAHTSYLNAILEGCFLLISDVSGSADDSSLGSHQPMNSARPATASNPLLYQRLHGLLDVILSFSSLLANLYTAAYAYSETVGTVARGRPPKNIYSVPTLTPVTSGANHTDMEAAHLRTSSDDEAEGQWSANDQNLYERTINSSKGSAERQEGYSYVSKYPPHRSGSAYTVRGRSAGNEDDCKTPQKGLTRRPNDRLNEDGIKFVKQLDIFPMECLRELSQIELSYNRNILDFLRLLRALHADTKSDSIGALYLRLDFNGYYAVDNEVLRRVAPPLSGRGGGVKNLMAIKTSIEGDLLQGEATSDDVRSKEVENIGKMWQTSQLGSGGYNGHDVHDMGEPQCFRGKQWDDECCVVGDAGSADVYGGDDRMAVDADSGEMMEYEGQYSVGEEGQFGGEEAENWLEQTGEWDDLDSGSRIQGNNAADVECKDNGSYHRQVNVNVRERQTRVPKKGPSGEYEGTGTSRDDGRRGLLGAVSKFSGQDFQNIDQHEETGGGRTKTVMSEVSSTFKGAKIIFDKNEFESNFQSENDGSDNTQSRPLSMASSRQIRQDPRRKIIGELKKGQKTISTTNSGQLARWK